MDPDLASFSGRAPIFPLPNLVLYPGVVLPLHIFEERYREMTRAALAGERLIAMATLRPGWEPDYHASPEIFPTVGLGRILQEQALDDGRFNLVVRGVGRAKVLEEDRSRPYRVGRLELLEERSPDDPRFEQVRLGLLAVYATIIREVLKEPWKADPAMELGTLCDLISARLDLDIVTRHELFGELDLGARALRIIELLQKSPLSGGAMRSALKSSRTFPPDPGLN
jgi:hypothetical protein